MFNRGCPWWPLCSQTNREKDTYASQYFQHTNTLATTNWAPCRTCSAAWHFARPAVPKARKNHRCSSRWIKWGLDTSIYDHGIVEKMTIDYAILGYTILGPSGKWAKTSIMVYGHAQSYSTIDGQLGSGQNWDAKEIASFSATNNTSLVPWLLDVFVSTLIPFSNLPEIARNDPAGLTSSIPHKFPDILHSVYPGVPFNSPGGFGTDFGSFWAPDVSSVLGTPGLAM